MTLDLILTFHNKYVGNFKSIIVSSNSIDSDNSQSLTPFATKTN